LYFIDGRGVFGDALVALARRAGDAPALPSTAIGSSVAVTRIDRRDATPGARTMVDSRS
jgi:hypothetical protein